MAKYKIQGINNQAWDVEASKYRLESDFFHFYSYENEQLFAVKADLVKTIRAEDATKA